MCNCSRLEYKFITNTALIRARLCKLQRKGALDSQPQVIQLTSCLPKVDGSLRVLRRYTRKMNHEYNWEKYHTDGTFLKSNRQIVERDRALCVLYFFMATAPTPLVCWLEANVAEMLRFYYFVTEACRETSWYTNLNNVEYVV